MVESSLILYEDQIISFSLGLPTEVEFSYEELRFFRRLCKSYDPNKLKFYHVHPGGSVEYSKVDLNCIKGFNIETGVSIYFSIIAFPHDEELCYLQKSYKFIEGEMRVVEDLNMLDKHVILLKSLSYLS